MNSLEDAYLNIAKEEERLLRELYSGNHDAILENRGNVDIQNVSSHDSSSNTSRLLQS
jgi:hypothetical protein